MKINKLFIFILFMITLSLGSMSCGEKEENYAQKIPVLAYHKLIPAGSERNNGLEIDAAIFEEQMKYLHDEGYRTLTLDEFYQWHEGDLELPEKSVVITFDDGYYSMYYLAYPILRKYDLSATVFLIGRLIKDTTDEFDYADNVKNHYIGLDAIEEIQSEYPPFRFESHTYAMHDRTKDGGKPAEVYTRDQILDDCSKMEKFGFEYLAYPWGTYSNTMQDVLKESGYKMAFAYDPFYYALRSDDAYAVNRIKISGGIKMSSFKKIVCGDDSDYDNPDAPENQ